MPPQTFPGGWNPRPYDGRDYKMRSFLSPPSSRAVAIQALVDEAKRVHKSLITPNSVDRWIQLATKLLVDMPVAPTPVPVDPVPPVDPNVPPAITSKLWTAPTVLDQGQTPHCVGFAESGFLATDPVMDPGITNQFAHDTYYRIKEIEGEPRAETGAYVSSAGKDLKARGRVAGYAFSDTTEDVCDWLLTKGPVQCGSSWFSGMMDTNSSGFVVPTGTNEGGHSYLAIGFDKILEVLTFLQSWGDWGIKGFFKMHKGDFADLIAQGGEGMAMLELPL